MPEQAYKRCWSCDQRKPVEAFGRNAARPDGRSGECRECRRIRQREWRRKNPDKVRAQRQRVREGELERQRKWRRDPRRQHAYYKVRIALRDGELVRPDVCSRCGNPGKIEAHHHDYDKPLEIEWLCPVCHQGDEHPRRAA